jgi:cytoskeleton-associated protein 5
VKVLDMLKSLFQLFVEREYRLSDYEAKVLFPALVEKSGHNQDRIRADHRDIMKKACMVYPAVKVTAFVKVGALGLAFT